MFKERAMSKRTAFSEPQAPASYGNLLEMRIQACTSLIQSDTLGTRPSQRLQGDLKQESRDWRQKLGIWKKPADRGRFNLFPTRASYC